MKHKGIITFLSFLLVLDIAAAGIGYKYSKKNTNVVEPVIEEKIDYTYYLEDEQVGEMPTNNIETTDENVDENIDTTNENSNQYLFSHYNCNNDINGEFNTETWTFEPTVVKSGTCELYFVKAYYDVTLTVTNGTEDENNQKNIEREQSGIFSIKPDEGYEFDESQCSDNKEGIWDESNNTFTLSAITKDVACKISFKIKNLSMKIIVKNGKGDTTENADYGETISAIVKPNTGYEKPSIKCTNKQNATYENNKLTVNKLTDNTTCTVTFKLKPLDKYKLKVSIDNTDKYSIIAGSQEQSIEKGKTGSFTIQSLEEGVEPNIDCGGINPSKVEPGDSNSYKYTFLNITDDITCKIKD